MRSPVFVNLRGTFFPFPQDLYAVQLGFNPPFVLFRRTVFMMKLILPKGAFLTFFAF